MLDGSAGVRLADYLTVGYLALHDAQSERQRGLPHEVLVI